MEAQDKKEEVEVEEVGGVHKVVEREEVARREEKARGICFLYTSTNHS